MVWYRLRDWLLYGNMDEIDPGTDLPLESQGSTATWVKVTIMIGVGAAVTYWIYKKWFPSTTSIPQKRTHLFIDKNENHKVHIIEKEHVTHDVRRLRLKLPHDEMISGIMPGKHINGQNLVRFYSPVSAPDAKGHFEIILKIYPSIEGDPKAGVFSRHIDSHDVGDHLTISGPYGAYAYQGNGTFLIRDKEHTTFKHVAMIAGGTGITPMLQLIRSLIRNKADPTHVALLYTNKTLDDIICREELEEYASEETGSHRFKLILTLTRVSKELHPDWPYHFGRISPEMVKELFPPPSEDVLVLICGPKGMNTTAKAICEVMGYTNIHVY